MAAPEVVSTPAAGLSTISVAVTFSPSVSATTMSPRSTQPASSANPMVWVMPLAVGASLTAVTGKESAPAAEPPRPSETV